MLYHFLCTTIPVPKPNSILNFNGQLSLNSLIPVRPKRYHGVWQSGQLIAPPHNTLNKHLDPKMCPQPGVVTLTATSHIVRLGHQSSSQLWKSRRGGDGWCGTCGYLERCAGSGDDAGVGSIGRWISLHIGLTQNMQFLWPSASITIGMISRWLFKKYTNGGMGKLHLSNVSLRVTSVGAMWISWYPVVTQFAIGALV